MTKRMFAYVAAVILSGGIGLYSGCGTTVAGNDCKVHCSDADNVCIQKCTDDTCRTACKTDLDNCSASCDSVVVTTPDGG